MKSMIKFVSMSGLMLGCVLVLTATANAQGRGGKIGGGGGGGARPSMGHVGGGGGRPSMGGGGMPNMSRPMPNVSRPMPNVGGMASLGGAGRPSVGNLSKPNLPTPGVRPNLPNVDVGGSFHPAGGGRPNINLPTVNPTGPGSASRPSVKPLPGLKPTTRPSLPSGENNGFTNKLPDLANRPGGVNRPNLNNPNINKPSINPPDFGQSNINRPSIGNITRPSLPGGNTRPNIGGNNNNNIIGGNGNRPSIGNGIQTGNINIGNTVQIGNGNGNSFVNAIGNKGGNFATTLPAWDRPGFTKPGWGIGVPGAGNWSANWHDHCIHHHHVWYNGCWDHGYWGSQWYRPVAWVSVGWGLGSLTNAWGYGAAYYNPYYLPPVGVTSVPYNYSQPVVINNYIPVETASSVVGNQAVSDTGSTESPQALSTFDQGLTQFKSGNYQQALTTLDAALKQLPGDPVVHEVRALTLFALGQYTPAAASLNSLLSSAPGMDWTTMSSLYGNPDDHTKQLRALEQYCRNHREDPASAFVLAYHYLVLGAKENAVNALKVVVKQQPKDAVAKRMLDALTAAGEPSPTSATQDSANTDAASTDLVGNWRATTSDTTIDLTITSDSQFVWKASTKGQQPVELKGQLTADNDAVVLVNEQQGSMAGTVKSLGADQWQWFLEGAPPNSPAIQFQRVRAL